MKQRLFTLALALMFITPFANSQQRGEVLDVDTIAILSVAQTQDLINNFSPLDLPDFILNLLTDIDYSIVGIKVVYGTVDFNNNPTIASGLVVVPVNPCPKDMMVYCHGTVFNKQQVPSNGLEIIYGLLYGGNGYLTVMPDYLGLGESPDFHLYVDEKTEATATLDLMVATKQLALAGNVPLTNKVFISGYSQGGHGGMSTFRLLQEAGGAGFNLRTAGLGSGPYNTSGIQYEFILNDPFYAWPEFVLYVIASCEEAYGNIYNSPSDILVPPYDALYETDILGQTGNVGWAISPYTDMLVPEFYQEIQAENSAMRQCLAASNVHNWNNRKPTTMYYCTEDEEVAFQNSILAEHRFEARLPWYLFWMRALINSKYIGPLNHGDCVVPYTLVSKLGFDLRQTHCPSPAQPDESSQPMASADGFIERAANYYQVDIRTDGFPAPIEKAEFFRFDGTLAAMLNDFQKKENGIRLDVRELDRGAYVLRLTDAKGNTADELLLLEEVQLLKHKDYNPLSYREAESEYELDLSLLQEPVQSLLIYGEERQLVQEIDAKGALENISFSAKGLPTAGTLEVRTAQNSYFLELQAQPKGSGNSLLSFFPNPARQSITIRLAGEEAISSATLFDSQGRQVWSRENVQRQAISPEITLPVGAYQLRVVTASGKVLVERVLVVR